MGKKGNSIKSYNQAREMLQEADKKFGRALLLSKKGDYCGAVEASQHCVEFAIKSLFILMSLDPPRIHDPGKFINKVIEALKDKIHLDNGLSKETMDPFYRLRYLSHLLERLHTEGMYGYDDMLPSKIFSKEDAEYFTYCALEVQWICIFISLAVGHRFGFLSNKERVGIQLLKKHFTST